MLGTAARALCLALGAALAACSTPARPAGPGVAGDITFDETGTVAVRVPLEWPEYDAPRRSGHETYEVRFWQARDGLPGEEAARVDGIRGNRAALAVHLPRGDYVWSVRAHFVRDGWPCVSGWYFVGLSSDDRLLPRRSFARFSVP